MTQIRGFLVHILKIKHVKNIQHNGTFGNKSYKDLDQRVTKIQIKEISVKRLMKKFTVGNFILMSFGVNNVPIHFMLN
jgi:hypothetical protein